MSFKDLPIINLFFREKEKEKYPTRFIKITLSDVAKIKGLNDEHNRIINIIEYGEVVKEMEYSKELLEALIEIDPMPVFEESYDTEEFEYDVFEALGQASYKVKK